MINGNGERKTNKLSLDRVVKISYRKKWMKK